MINNNNSSKGFLLTASSSFVAVVAVTSLLRVQQLQSVSSFSIPSTTLSSYNGGLMIRDHTATAAPLAVFPSTTKNTPSSSTSSSSRHHAQHHVLYMTSDAVAMPGSSDDDGSSSDADTVSDNDGDATVTQLIFNLVKGIVGAGVLSLPAGIAAFASGPTGVIPAVSLIAIIGGLSAYGFALIGRCCAYTNTKSYRDAWSATVSEKSSWLPATAVTVKTICACLAYSMILGDTFVSLLSTVGMASSKVPVTIGLTSIVLLPLCLMKNLSSLAPFSLVGSLGMLYTAVAMCVRYFGKAYTATGGFGNDMAPSLRPKFGPVGAAGVFTPSAAILVSMLSTAYMAHFNAPKVRSVSVMLCYVTISNGTDLVVSLARVRMFSFTSSSKLTLPFLHLSLSIFNNKISSFTMD